VVGHLTQKLSGEAWSDAVADEAQILRRMLVSHNEKLPQKQSNGPQRKLCILQIQLRSSGGAKQLLLPNTMSAVDKATLLAC